MPAAKGQQWTPEEDALFRRLLSEGRSFIDIGPSFPNRTQRAIQCRAYTLRLKSGTPRLKHSKNETFWTVPNPINSYYAGLAAADMSLNTDNNTLSWQCHSKDEQYVERFIAECAFTGKLFHTIESPTSVHANLRIGTCQRWHVDMSVNFNLEPNKTHRLAPPAFASDLLACCYLIGYTDGDGCIHANANGVAQIAYVSASLIIIEWIKAFVDQHFRFQIKKRQSHVHTSVNGNYHCYPVYGMTAVKMFLLLRTIDVPMFARKWSDPRFIALVNAYRAKWPEYFVPEMELSFDENRNIVRGQLTTPHHEHAISL